MAGQGFEKQEVEWEMKRANQGEKLEGEQGRGLRKRMRKKKEKPTV